MKNINEQGICDTLETNYMPYAMSVIISRAIPEIDGFKPSHRKLLYTMYKMGLLTGNKTKSANIVGQTMKLNPHGDMAIYETLVRLTRGNDTLLHPLIDSKGNFGKRYSRDMAFAAARYTECKLDAICNEIFTDIDKNTVEFIDNYDGTMKEPKLLPTTFPNILVNPNQGIAVGMASNICSFNLTEVCDATIAYMKNNDTDLLLFIKAPDFSSGGQLIYSEKDLRDIYSTGRGSIKVRAKYKFDKSNNCIDINEIPYSTSSEAIIDSIIELVKDNKIKDISDVRDETDLSGLKITIDMKRGSNTQEDADNLMQRLFLLTPLQDSFSCNFNILINGRPRVMGVKEIIHEWVIFRADCIKRQTAYDIARKEEKLHLLLGLEKILLDIDKAIKIIRETEKDSLVIPNLMDGYGIDQIQAEFIAEIKLRNLNKEYILKRLAEISDLTKDIANLIAILGDDIKVKKIITKQLQEISKKYGKPRKTEIISIEAFEQVSREDMFVEDYKLKIFLTKENYLKKIPLTSLRTNPDQKLKEDDEVMQEIETKNKSDLLLFSNKQAVYKVKIHEISDCKASSLGEYLPNLLSLTEDEKILYIVGTDDYEGNMLFAFESGKIAKVTLNSYATKTNRKKLANAYFANSGLVDVRFIKEDLDLVAFSSIGKVLIFNTSDIGIKSTKNSQGVQVLISKKDSRMVKIRQLLEVDFANIGFYRTKNIPATGHYIKEEDKFSQLKLE